MKQRKRNTILVIDDQQVILTAAARILRSAGFVVYTCELWSKVPGFIRRVRPDLVLLDYNMPSLKGDEICLILKKSSVSADMKVVFHSGEEEGLLRRLCAECGADGYIQKSADARLFLSRVQTFLQEGGPSAVALPVPGRATDQTVLLVDDSEVFRKMCRRMLTLRYAFRVEDAGNGLKGLEMLSSLPGLSLVLLDVNMPVMNGLEFLERIRQNQIHVPIIVCSTEDREEDIYRALSLGARGYIIKPFVPEALFSVIEKVLR